MFSKRNKLVVVFVLNGANFMLLSSQQLLRFVGEKHDTSMGLDLYCTMVILTAIGEGRVKHLAVLF